VALNHTQSLIHTQAANIQVLPSCWAAPAAPYLPYRHPPSTHTLEHRLRADSHRLRLRHHQLVPPVSTSTPIMAFRKTRCRNVGTDSDDPTFFRPSYLDQGPRPADPEAEDLTASTLSTGELDTLLPTWPCAGIQVPSEDSDVHKEPCTGREGEFEAEVLQCGGVAEGKLSARYSGEQVVARHRGY